MTTKLKTVKEAIEVIKELQTIAKRQRGEIEKLKEEVRSLQMKADPTSIFKGILN